MIAQPNAPVLSGALALRPAEVALPAGALFYATDALTLYVVAVVGGQKVWEVAGGTAATGATGGSVQGTIAFSGLVNFNIGGGVAANDNTLMTGTLLHVPVAAGKTVRNLTINLPANAEARTFLFDLQNAGASLLGVTFAGDSGTKTSTGSAVMAAGGLLDLLVTLSGGAEVASQHFAGTLEIF